MKQEPRAQIPGIDLTFPDGKTGWIWGISGVDDLRGATFEKAGLYLRDRAKREGAFNWTIVLELDHIGSPAFRSLLNMMSVLNQLVIEKPDRRAIAIEWVIKSGDDSMVSMANEMIGHFKKQKGKRLEIKIVDRGRARPSRT